MVGFLACLLAAYRFIEARHAEGLNDLDLNLSTGLLGVVASTGVTLFFLDKLNERRDRNNLKQRLKGEAGSRSHDIAISAVEWMDREGWLRGEDGLLKGADLREAQLKGAWMDGANFERAKLRNADLRGARLEGARFRCAKMPESRLYRAKLNRARMRCSYLGSAYAERADFSGACLQNATLDSICLRDAILNDACFVGASLKQAKFHGAALIGTDFSRAILIAAKLKNASYPNQAIWEGAKLRYVDLRGVDFSDANMKEADLECANLEGADLWGTNLEGANLLGAKLKGVQFNPFDPPEESIFDDPAFGDGPVFTGEPHQKTKWLGATLPDGTVFTEDMDYKAILRFTNP